MPRIIAIDYGLKRTGIAVTDPLQIIATGLTTVASPQLIDFLKKYCEQEPVEKIIIGEPKNLDGSATHATLPVEKVIERIRKALPHIPIEKADERFTSKLAVQAMIDMGMKKKQRRDKAKIDEIAATILLQEYLNHN
ncbi:MAG: Holliday junction resolvase RuvX [Chitinophagaceae bacterium]|nr:Holliday junction resolvase RuvX [Chitinophagaceae bacterium]